VLTDRSELTAGREFGVMSGSVWRLADLFAKHAFLLQGLGWGGMKKPVISTRFFHLKANFFCNCSFARRSLSSSLTGKTLTNMNNNFGDRPRARSHGLRAIVFAAFLAAVSLNGMTYGADASVVAPLNPASDAAPAGTPTAEDIATLLNVRFHVGLHEALKIGRAVVHAAQRDTISPLLLLAVIAVESNFDRFAVSVAGARGLMQILPSQLKDLVLRASDLNDAGTNVSIGSSILHDYVEASDGDVHGALLRYSGGAKDYPRRVADRVSMMKTAFRVHPDCPASAASATFGY
jgi:soluble lytic murein transglycosylase-like protein